MHTRTRSLPTLSRLGINHLVGGRRKPGERIKTDRRDAQELAEYFKAGSLTRVHPPDEEQETVRDLCRCREAALGTLGRHRHQLGKLLLRRDIRFEGGKRPWTHRHRQWFHGLQFDNPIDQIMFDDYLLAIEQAKVTQYRPEYNISLKFLSIPPM